MASRLRPVAVVAISCVLCACEGAAPAPTTPPPPLAAVSAPPSPPLASATLPAPPASSSPAPPCGTACTGDRACRLTTSGPACVACDPEAVPTCKDDRFIATCNGDGTVVTTDCAAQKKRCLNGTCAATLCAPGREHCHNGRLFRCNAAGSGRTLVADCRAESDAGTFQICQAGVSPPACRGTCKSPKGMTMVLAKDDDCTCSFADVPFCEEQSPESGCGTTLCASGQLTVGATMLPCERQTDGLVVPGSERRGPCAGSGEIGTVAIDYQVCRDGKPAPASRRAPCRR